MVSGYVFQTLFPRAQKFKGSASGAAMALKNKGKSHIPKHRGSLLCVIQSCASSIMY